MGVESRLERHLMRQRGAGGRELKSGHFGFTIGRVNTNSSPAMAPLPASVNVEESLEIDRTVGKHSIEEEYITKPAQYAETPEVELERRGRRRKNVARPEATATAAATILNVAIEPEGQALQPQLVEEPRNLKRKRRAPTRARQADGEDVQPLPDNVQERNEKATAMPRIRKTKRTAKKQGTELGFPDRTISIGNVKTTLPNSEVLITAEVIVAPEVTPPRRTSRRTRTMKKLVSYKEREEIDIPKVEVQCRARRVPRIKATLGQDLVDPEKVVQPATRVMHSRKQEIMAKVVSMSNTLCEKGQMDGANETIPEVPDVPEIIEDPAEIRKTRKRRASDSAPELALEVEPRNSRKEEKLVTEFMLDVEGKVDEYESVVDAELAAKSEEVVEIVEQMDADVTAPVVKKPTRRGWPPKSRVNPAKFAETINLPFASAAATRKTINRRRKHDVGLDPSPEALPATHSTSEMDREQGQDNRSSKIELKDPLVARSFNLPPRRPMKNAARLAPTSWEKPDWFEPIMPKTLMQTTDSRLRFRM